MDKLPKNAYKILKKITKLEPFNITVGQIGAIKILEDKGYIKFHQHPTLESLSKNCDWRYYFTITSEGKIYLSEIKHESFRFWIPILLSNLIASVALIISVFALLKQ